MYRFALSLLTSAFLFSSAHLYSQALMESLSKSQSTPQIVVQNRVLAKVNDKPITVLDVVKKMDVVFYKQYPQYANAPEARYQFYLASWKSVLNELVDKELFLSDAEEVQMTISDSDARKELEDMFGPNVVVNLDGAGLTFDEAKKMVQDEIIIRRMVYLRVHSKVLNTVTPQELRRAYDEYAKGYEKDDTFRYNVITIKSPSRRRLETFVNNSTEFLKENSVSLEDLPMAIKSVPGYDVFTTVRVSDTFDQSGKDVSDRYSALLSKIEGSGYSEPLWQKRESNDQNASVKLLYLQEVVKDDVPPFYEVAPKLKNDLMAELSEGEMKEYKERLYKQYPVTIMENLIKSNFNPFQLEVDGRRIHLSEPTT